MAGTKYHPSTPCGSQDFYFPGLLCITIFLPEGHKGVLLKSKFPSNVTFSESFRFYLSVLNRFRVIWDCLRRRNHRCIGEMFPTPHSPRMKWLFHTWMYQSATFVLCMCGGNNCNTNDFFLSKHLSASEALLSSQRVSGFNPLLGNSSSAFL